MPKMTLEHARKLRDQERGKVAPPPMFDPHPGDTKQREIRFDHARPEQLEQARLMLSGLERLELEPGHHDNGLLVRYSIQDYTLQGLETAHCAEAHRRRSDAKAAADGGGRDHGSAGRSGADTGCRCRCGCRGRRVGAEKGAAGASSDDDLPQAFARARSIRRVGPIAAAAR